MGTRYNKDMEKRVTREEMSLQKARLIAPNFQPFDAVHYLGPHERAPMTMDESRLREAAAVYETEMAGFG